MSRQNSDITNLRATTTSLDREKDGLQVSLDERTERAVALEDQLARRERELADMRVTISDLEVLFAYVCCSVRQKFFPVPVSLDLITV